MKKLLYILLLFPFWSQAQVNGTIQKTPATGTVRGNFGSSGLDTLPRVTGILLNGGLLSYNSTTNRWSAVAPSTISPDTTIYRTVANSRSLAQTQTALNLKANLASPTFTGTVTTAALNSSSFSATAVNGIAASVTNNAAGFAPLVVTNNGAGNLQTWSNSGGVVGTIGNSGAISLSAGVNATTGIFSTSVNSVAGSFTNTDATNGYGLKIASGGTAATRYALSIKNIAETTTFLQVSTETGKVGNVGINTDAPTEKLHVVGNGLFTGTLNASNLSGTNTGDQTSVTGNAGTATALQTARTINGTSFDGTANITVTATPTAGTAVTSITGTANQVTASSSTGAVTLSLPQSIATNSDVRFNSLGLGAAPLYPLDVTRSVSSNYAAHIHNTNTTAGTSFGLNIKGGTNASDRALNINNAANLLGLFAVLGNGALEIGQTPATSAATYDLLSRNTSTGLLEKTSVLPSTTTATTQTAGDNSTKVATTAYVDGGNFVKINPGAQQNGAISVGGISLQATSTTGNLTLANNNYFAGMDASGASSTVTLPSLASVGFGKIFVIKKIDSTANTVTIDGNGTETIDGSLTKVLSTQYSGYTLISFGSTWYIIGTF